MQTGASLVPTYCFGENNTFRTANELPRDSRIRRVQRRIAKATGFTIPIYSGTGLFLPFGFLPFPVQMDVVVGAPIEVPRFTGALAASSPLFAACLPGPRGSLPGCLPGGPHAWSPEPEA